MTSGMATAAAGSSDPVPAADAEKGAGLNPALVFQDNLNEARREARSSGRGILVVQEPVWTNAVQRLQHVAQRDADLAGLIGKSFVPVLVDPVRQPVENERLQAAAALSGMPMGVPSISVLDSEGRYIVGYGTLAFEGERFGQDQSGYPSLKSVLLACQGKSGEVDAIDGPGTDLPRPSLLPRDEAVGDPRILDPFAFLTRIERGDVAGVGTDVGRILRGGVWDHVFGGFHRSAREPRFILPQFEKITLQNLGMAMVLARLAEADPSEDAKLALEQQLSFLRKLLAGGPTVIGLESDTRRHTWLPAEFFAVVGGDLAFYAGTRYGMTQSKVQHVIYGARSIEDTAAACAVGVGELTSLLDEARRRLAAFKDQSAPARAVESPDPVDAASVIWLALELEKSASIGLGWSLEKAALHYSLDVLGRAEDLMEKALRVALLASCCRAKDADIRSAARRSLPGLAEELLGRHADGETGTCLDGLRLPSVGVAVRALMEAARELSDARLSDAAGNVLERYRPLLEAAPDRVGALSWLSN